MKTLILGIGNTILSDDGVGIYVVRNLKNRIKDDNVTIEETQLAGIHLIHYLLQGYEKIIIIDAIQLKDGNLGDVLKFTPDDFLKNNKFNSIHHVDIFNILTIAKNLKIILPKSIIIYGISVKDPYTISENCTEEIQNKLSEIVDRIYNDINL